MNVQKLEKCVLLDSRCWIDYAKLFVLATPLGSDDKLLLPIDFLFDPNFFAALDDYREAHIVMQADHLPHAFWAVHPLRIDGKTVYNTLFVRECAFYHLKIKNLEWLGSALYMHLKELFKSNSYTIMEWSNPVTLHDNRLWVASTRWSVEIDVNMLDTADMDERGMRSPCNDPITLRIVNKFGIVPKPVVKKIEQKIKFVQTLRTPYHHAFTRLSSYIKNP